MLIPNDKSQQISHKTISASKQNWAVKLNDFDSTLEFIDCANSYVQVGGIKIW